MEIREYDLQDMELLKEEQHFFHFMVWQPAFVSVILGQSNKAAPSLRMENILKDKVPVYKRPSGGETVVLSPRTLVISILRRGDKLQSPSIYFKAYGQGIIRALEGLGVGDLRGNGISDICIGERKIVGSSIYRNKDLVFYHAVLNVSESTDILERYLKHPQREPEYRRGRTHSDFVTSLTHEGYDLPTEEVKQAISDSFSHLKMQETIK
ncbi:MAG: hypothetical protein GY950_15085 [bacterium]|nr:hypothetical protein [bacterium]